MTTGVALNAESVQPGGSADLDGAVVVDAGGLELISTSGATDDLLVTPPPSIDHGFTTHLLMRALASHAPEDVEVLTVGLGVHLPGSIYIPDLLVTTSDALMRGGKALEAPDVLLVVEVLSPSNSRNDLVLKRHDYAAAGIPAYWIVDPRAPTITVLELAERGEHEQRAVLEPGLTWTTDRPFSGTAQHQPPD